eukprot:c18523_g1_i1.p1 GENE.c18523_g1_i1~~c18523_g1_i1.p1  ORF type:complete len:667 (-),score=28.69 c18523_g1_i1:25-2025(-)
MTAIIERSGDNKNTSKNSNDNNTNNISNGSILYLERCINPRTISFSNLQFEVKKKDKDPLQILRGVTGTFRASRLTAVMGSSGAGKTTLLSAIGGFIDNVAGGSLSGKITMNGKEVSGDDVRHVSAFVFQDDTLLETMTVFEAIMISASLRLPDSMTAEEQRRKVENVIESLGLSHVKNSTLGSSLSRGISGGEKKRVAIAVEMVCNPDILFLDEPTSGLDAFMSLNVIKKLKAVAKTGRTIVCTIHQPSSEIFSEFDDLILMAKGKVAYMGEVGDQAKTIVEYFDNLNFHCPPYSNPADYIFTHVLNVSFSESTSKSDEIKAIRDENVEKLISAWDAVSEEANNAAIAASDIALSKYLDDNGSINSSSGNLSSIKSGHRSSLLKQTKLLSIRSFNNFMRNPALFKAKAGSGVILALIVGLLYLRLGKSQKTINSRIGAEFFMAINNLFGSVMPMLSVFAGEKAVFRREYGTGMYSLPAYLFSKVVVESALSFLVSIIGSTIIYFIIGYQETGLKWFIYTLANGVETVVGNAVGLAFGAMFNDVQKALAVVPLFLIPLMLFSGYFQNNDRIGWWFNWFKFFSPIKYTFEIMFQTEFKGLHLHCSEDEYFEENGQEYCQYTNGEQVIKVFGVDYISVGALFGCLISLFVLFVVIAYVNLYIAVTRKN